MDNTFLHAVCEVNEYIHPTSGVCAACPTDSTSAGGNPSMCTCNAGTGRVNETDVTLPCLRECHNTAHLICGGFRRELNCSNAISTLS